MWVAHHHFLYEGKAQSMIFLVEFFCYFVEKNFRKKVLSKFLFKIKNNQKTNQKATKIATIAYSMKGCLRLLNFIF